MSWWGFRSQENDVKARPLRELTHYFPLLEVVRFEFKGKASGVWPTTTDDENGAPRMVLNSTIPISKFYVENIILWKFDIGGFSIADTLRKLQLTHQQPEPQPCVFSGSWVVLYSPISAASEFQADLSEKYTLWFFGNLYFLNMKIFILRHPARQPSLHSPRTPEGSSEPGLSKKEHKRRRKQKLAAHCRFWSVSHRFWSIYEMNIKMAATQWRWREQGFAAHWCRFSGEKSSQSIRFWDILVLRGKSKRKNQNQSTPKKSQQTNQVKICFVLFDKLWIFDSLWLLYGLFLTPLWSTFETPYLSPERKKSRCSPIWERTRLSNAAFFFREKNTNSKRCWKTWRFSANGRRS